MKRTKSDRFPKMILEWNSEGRKRNRESKEQRVDGVTRSIINRDLTEEDKETRGLR